MPDKELRWTKDSFARVIANPLYAGIITCGDEEVTGEHEAIISRELWERAQRLLNGHARGPQVHGVNPDYVLHGLLGCGKYGEAMCAASTRKGDTVHRYYRCMTRDKFGKVCCGAAPLAAGAIEGYVADRIAEWATRVLSNFRTVWDAMNALNRGRRLRGLLDRVVVDERKGNVHLHFVDHASELVPMGAKTEAA